MLVALIMAEFYNSVLFGINNSEGAESSSSNIQTSFNYYHSAVCCFNIKNNADYIYKRYMFIAESPQFRMKKGSLFTTII